MSTVVQSLMGQIRQLNDAERAEFSNAYYQYSNANLERLRQESHEDFVRQGMSEDAVDQLIDKKIAELRAGTLR